MKLIAPVYYLGDLVAATDTERYACVPLTSIMASRQIAQCLCLRLQSTFLSDSQGVSEVPFAQVAVALDGSLFVGDGYCNSRVEKFSAQGEWRGEFVVPGEPLRNPHSVVLQECSRALYVAEREAARVHRFSLDTRQLDGGEQAPSRCLATQQINYSWKGIEPMQRHKKCLCRNMKGHPMLSKGWWAIR